MTKEYLDLKFEPYNLLTPTIFITILNYPLFPTITNEFHTIFHVKEEKENFLWSNHLQFHVFDLSNFMVRWRKYRREMKENYSKKAPWLLMFSAVDYRKKLVEQEILSDLEEWAMNIEEVREALIEWETLSANKENQTIFEARAKELRDLLSNLEGKRREGLEEGIKEGIKKGRKEEKINTAVEMLKQGLTIELIEKVTKLSRNEVEELTDQI